MSVSDRVVRNIYEAFSQFVSTTLRNEDNPSLKVSAFNEMPEHPLASIEIPLTGMRMGSMTEMVQLLDQFIYPGTDIMFEENTTGTFEFYAQIPIPRSQGGGSRKRSKSRKRHHHHRHHVRDDTPSCSPLLGAIAALAVVMATGYMRGL